MIFLVSFTGILVYRFEMSNEARVKWGRIGVFSSFFSTSVVFSRLCVLGSGATSFIFWVNNWANLYARAPLQFTTGRIGCSDLCSLISPLIDGRKLINLVAVMQKCTMRTDVLVGEKLSVGRGQ